MHAIICTKKMKIMLLHIALEIIQNDLQPFYIDILGGSIKNHKILKAQDAASIFQINSETAVYDISIQDIYFEMFVHNKFQTKSFSHVCLALHNAFEIYKKAKENNYWAFLRKNNQWKTYFIKDNNGNMFEIKHKE